MTKQHQVADLHGRHPTLTAAQLAARLDTRPEYIRSVAKRLGLILPGALVSHAKFDAAVGALEEIRDGLANTLDDDGNWHTRIQKRDAWAIADTAIKAARAAR